MFVRVTDDSYKRDRKYSRVVSEQYHCLHRQVTGFFRPSISIVFIETKNSHVTTKCLFTARFFSVPVSALFKISRFIRKENVECSYARYYNHVHFLLNKNDGAQSNVCFVTFKLRERKDRKTRIQRRRYSYGKSDHLQWTDKTRLNSHAEGRHARRGRQENEK